MKNPIRATLKGQLMALILLALIPAFGLAIFHSFSQFNDQKNAIAENTLRLTRLVYANQVHIVEGVKEFLTAMSHFDGVRGDDMARCEEVMDTLKESFVAYAAFGKIGQNGNILCSSSPAILQQQAADVSFFKQAVATRSFAAGPYEINQLTGKLIAFFGLPIFDNAKRTSGVVYAVLDLARFSQMPAAVQLPPDSTLMIFDHKGLILARYPDFELWTGSYRPKTPLLQVIEPGKLEGKAELVGPDGVQRLFAYHLLHEVPYQKVYVAIGIATVSAYAEARNQLAKQLFSLIVVYLLVASAVWIGSDKLVIQKMRLLNEATKRIGEGQLATRSNVGGENEVGQLARAVDEMARATQYRVNLLQQYSLEMYKLKEMNESLQAAMTHTEVFATVRRFSQEFFPDWFGGVYLLADNGDSAELQMQWGGTPLRMEFFLGNCWALRRAKTYFTATDPSESPCSHVDQAVARNFICSPLVAQGEILGIFHLETAAPFSDAENRPDLLPIVQSIAEYTALTLANLTLREKLHAQAVRDGLTGLFNRRYMEESLIRETRRADRNGTSISVIMIDIDHFKRFNDTFGHAAGDALLRELGSLLERRTRGSDIVCRYGGEEFTVIRPGSSTEVARDIAETLRVSVQNLDVNVHGHPVGRVTVSLGVATYPKHANTWESMLHSADLALLEAKRNRNRVVIA